MSEKSRAPRNRTITLTVEEKLRFQTQLIQFDSPTPVEAVLNKTIHQNLLDSLDYLPAQFVDLLFIAYICTK